MVKLCPLLDKFERFTSGCKDIRMRKLKCVAFQWAGNFLNNGSKSVKLKWAIRKW